MPAATARKIMLRNAERRAAVQRVVSFMDAVAGRGWPRRMEKLDHFMDQDHPTAWLSGRKLVSARSLRRLEEYAARFGYAPSRSAPQPDRALAFRLSQFADA